ncbi:MAG TPA: hypothetical protein PKV40_00860 [Candidatus Kapabacteria bacterium]|nr:hypothetical protein [Candidatus Kapabacteria bacterium]
MKKQVPSYKKNVEIYFILYLAALMLLIPDLKEQEKKPKEAVADVNENLFRIYPEKNILIARLFVDSNGVHYLSLDSTNIIFYSGNVQQIDFDFQILNRELNQSLVINSSSNYSNFFKFYENRDLNLAYFYWKPPVLDKRNYVYNVKVTAKALLKVPASKSKEFELKNLTATTNFDLVVNYFDPRTGLPMMTSNQDTVRIASLDSNFFYTLGRNTQDLFINFEKDQVSSIAGDTWQNTAFIFGMDLSKDMSKKPEIKIINSPSNNNGTVSIQKIQGNSIVLQGKMPNFGSSKVKIKLYRKYDNSTVEDEFSLLPIEIRDPDFNTIIYPFRTNTIKPNFPALLDHSFSCRIRTNDGQVIQNSSGTGAFSFSVDNSFIGQNLILERFIDNRIYGKVYQIQVKDYPPPQIAQLQLVSTNKLKILVNTYGIVNNQENSVKNIEILGNAKYSELIGQTSTNPANLVFTQVYEITPANPNDKFTFKIRVQDQRGLWSELVEFPQ